MKVARVIPHKRLQRRFVYYSDPATVIVENTLLSQLPDNAIYMHST